jgi:hypothetical protein
MGLRIDGQLINKKGDCNLHRLKKSSRSDGSHVAVRQFMMASVTQDFTTRGDCLSNVLKTIFKFVAFAEGIERER